MKSSWNSILLTSSKFPSDRTVNNENMADHIFNNINHIFNNKNMVYMADR